MVSIVPLRQLGEIALGQISRQMTILTEPKPIERHNYFFVVLVRAEGHESNSDSAELATPVSQHVFNLSDFLASTVIEIHIFEFVD